MNTTILLTLVQGSLATLGIRTNAWGGDLSPYRNHIYIKQAAPVAIFGMDANGNSVFDETDKVKYDDRDTLIRNIDGQDLAVNFVSFYDLLAYAEFTGLRPMTELEYEKACRGPREPVNDEYAWGSVTRVLFSFPYHANMGDYYNMKADPNTLWDGNTGTEQVSAAYNCALATGYTASWNWWESWHYYHPAPLRVGIFADSTSTRAAAGATFWGVMNMSDNVAEMCISAYNEVGRAFEGAHGCGQLDGNGDATNKRWHISPDGLYYLRKGMNKPYWSWHGRGWQSNRTWTNELCLDCGLANSWVTNGMVSCRAMATYSVVGTERNYTINSDCIRGIRLVRTDKAQQ